MAEDKPIIILVEISDFLRRNLSDDLQSDFPTHTVVAVEDFNRASALLNRCLKLQQIPLVVTEARPLPPEADETPTERQYGSASTFIGHALDAGASVIVFTEPPLHVIALHPAANDPERITVIYKPNYDELRDEVLKFTSSVSRSAVPAITAEPVKQALKQAL
jgi:hypothetical protein